MAPKGKLESSSLDRVTPREEIGWEEGKEKKLFCCGLLKALNEGLLKGESRTFYCVLLCSTPCSCMKPLKTTKSCVKVCNFSAPAFLSSNSFKSCHFLCRFKKSAIEFLRGLQAGYREQGR